MQSVYNDVPGLHVVAMHTDPTQLDAALTDVVIIDAYVTGDRPCLGIIERLAGQTKVVVSALRWLPELHACLDVGASAYIDKGASPERYVETVQLVAEGKTVPDAAPRSTQKTPLSPREQSVLTHISQGLTHDQTARRLGISRHTVDTYVKRARAKMKLGNKADLTRSMLLANIHGASL
ncbi:helix-turn-helix transcriptional regulator [Stackebrandtia endophytica]|nr:LuxR C-terminal-related transcriptional regulator [Stackebrandtia endophytica]